MTDRNAPTWQRIRPILEQVLDTLPDERARLLEELCGDDVELRAQVEAYLDADEGAGAAPVLDQQVGEFAAELLDELRDELGPRLDGTTIGSYRLIRRLGEGGMAVVYLGERADQQYEQQVAIKLLRGGADGMALIRRFRAERQILASLNHANIARLLDGGVTPAGVPFLVMEYVEGEPIDRYCDARQLSIPQRLRLFLRVADAVRYAHRNLVVHRDLKPSNILITRDGDVKLLDFGIAKLLSDTSTTAATRTALHWLTPEYAAPEQLLEGSITTATDVYQLGAVLYELLSGSRPVAQSGDHHPLAPIDNPLPPSTAARRGQRHRAPSDDKRDAPRAEQRALRGDLDAIVLKAIRTEPDQRYHSVDALQDDVERYLAGRPVHARHGTFAYRTRKFVRRNRAAVAAVAAFLVLLAAYGVTLQAQARTTQRMLTDMTQQKEKAEGVTQLLLGLFNADAEIGLSDSVSARQLLDRGERQAEQLRDQPLMQAEMLSALGGVNYRIRNFERAQPLLERALTLRRQTLGELHPDVAGSLAQLAELVDDRGRHDEARRLHLQSIDIRRRVLAKDDPALAESLFLLSRVGGTNIDQAIALNREALAIRQRAHDPYHPLVAQELVNLGTLLRNKGDLVEAEALFRRSLNIRQRVFGPVHLEVARSAGQLATVAILQGDLAEGERLYRRALAIREQLHGKDHPEFASGALPLANLLTRMDQDDEAVALLRRALRIAERAWGSDHVRVADAAGLLANALAGTGQIEEAIALRRRELAIRTAVVGPEHNSVAGALGNLSMLLAQLGRQAEAESMMREAYEIRRRLFGAESPHSVVNLSRLGELVQARGDLAAAEALFLESLRVYRKHNYGDANEEVRRARAGLAAVYDSLGKPERAAQYRALLSRGSRN